MTYTQDTIINIKKKTIPNYSKYNNVCSYGIFFVGDSRTSSKEFKTAVVFEPSVFEAQKFYCNSQHCTTMLRQRKLIIQKTDKVKQDIITKQITGSISHKQNSLKSLRNGLWMDECNVTFLNSISDTLGRSDGANKWLFLM